MHRPGRVTSQDVREFARQFAEVCEGQPAEHYPVLLREHLIQRCRVASLGRSTTQAAQRITLEVCMGMCAFQTPLVGVLGGKDITKYVQCGKAREKLEECAGGEEELARSMLLVFNDNADKVDWSYVDSMTEAEILLLGTADASEMISMLMALTFSDCGKRNNTVVYRGRRTTPKTKILFSPPLGDPEEADSWRYNTDDTTHFWIGGARQLVSIDGACFEYCPGRSSIFMWSSAEHEDYEVVGSEKCDATLCLKMLDRLKQMLETVQYEIMDRWAF